MMCVHDRPDVCPKLSAVATAVRRAERPVVGIMTEASDGRWMELAGRRVRVDARGYLLDRDDWDEALAEAMAASDGVTLTTEHWRVLRLLRDYHERHGRSPAMRLLVVAVAEALGSARADSRLLYRLFPQGPAKQAARYAGLPRPTSCI